MCFGVVPCVRVVVCFGVVLCFEVVVCFAVIPCFGVVPWVGVVVCFGVFLFFGVVLCFGVAWLVDLLMRAGSFSQVKRIHGFWTEYFGLQIFSLGQMFDS